MAYRKVTRFVTARDGTRIAYHLHLDPKTGEKGLGQRPTLLLTSGIGTTENFWRHLVEGLSVDHRVVHWDYRGHGSSECAVKGEYDLTTQADDLARVTEAVVHDGDGVTRPLQVAFSMGVAVLLELYRDRPEQVPAMVLIAGSAEAPGSARFPLNLPAALPALRRFLEAATPAIPLIAPAVHKALQSRLVYPAGRALGLLRKRAEREDIDEFMQGLCRMQPLAYWQTLKGLMAASASDVLPQIRVPALIIAASHDLLMPRKQVERMRAALPHASYVEVEDAGHAGLLEAGAEVVAALRQFTGALGSVKLP